MFKLKPLSLFLVLLAVAGFVVVTLQLLPKSSEKPTQSLALKETIITLNLGTEPPTLDPALAVDLTSGTVIDQLYQGLTSFDEQSRVIPAVASKWDISHDGKVYIFHLRKDANWSDGSPVTAQQFLAAWQRILTPDTAAQYANFLFPIKGAKAFYDRKTTDFSTVGVKAITPKRLAITLEKPLSFLPSLMALSFANLGLKWFC